MAPAALPSLRPKSSSPFLGGPSSEQGRVSGPQADTSPTLVTCCLPLPAHSGQVLPSTDQRRRDAPPEGHDQDGDRAAGDQGNGPVSDWQCFCLEPRLGEPRTHSRALSWLGMADVPMGNPELRVEADSILMSSWGLPECRDGHCVVGN